jgi:hypothetical protein
MQQTLPGVCGLWLDMAGEDHIFHERHTTRPHQEHIVLHEIGHMLFGHRASDTGHGWASAFLPDLDPEMIGSLLGRVNYSTRQEREAEMVASLIRTSVCSTGGQRPKGVLERLEAGLGLNVPHDR